MDPIMRIVHYLFKKRQITITETNLEQFFENGVSFPLFISISFNVLQIPGIIKNPKNELQQKLNNNLALQYLFQNNQYIAKISPDYYTLNDKANLLILIFTKQCFNINEQEIISKCNLIVKPLKLQYKQKNDLFKENCILSLLNVLTDGKVQNSDDSSDFDMIMPQIFQQANVPLVIDKTSFDIQNQVLILIQIEIIFETFSDKINQIIKKPSSTTKNNDQQANSKNKQTKSNFEQTKSIDTSRLDINAIDVELDDDDDDSESDELLLNNNEISEEALLKTINSIGSKANLHFDNFVVAVKKDNPFRFIRIFFNNDQEFNKLFTNPMNRTINYVIKYLRTKDPIFGVLLFNFTDTKYIKSSSILFYTNFLNCYFLKKTKQEMFERCSTIIFSIPKKGDFFYDKYRTNMMNKKNPYEDKSILFMWETYLALLFFIKEKKIHFKIDQNKNIDKYFKKKNIPQIINQKFIKNCNFREKDALFYQLHFIFSYLDKHKYVYLFRESIFKTLKLLKNVRVPKYDLLAENIKVKNVSLIIQKKRYKAYLDTIKEEKGSTIVNDNPLKKKVQKFENPKTFNDRFKSKKKHNVNKKVTQTSLQSAELFWNPSENDLYSVEDGILYSNKPKKNELIQIIENYKANVIFNSNSDEQVFSSVSQKRIKFKLFKFFHYNEQSSKWEIDSSSVHSFNNEMHFQMNQKVSLILLSNSDENELNILCSKLTNNLTPDLDDDDIYVYGLCENAMSLLQHVEKLKKEGKEVKPLFLLLHLPKHKQKIENIKTIIFKIYYFLSIICDVEVVVLNKKHYNDQLDLLEKINNTKNSYRKTANLIKTAIFSPLKNQLKNDINMSSDGDYSDSCDDLNEDTNHSLQINEFNEVIENSNLNCFRKESKNIILINDESIQGDIVKTIETDFISNILNKFHTQFCHVNYINIKNDKTYRCFLASLNQFTFDVTTTFNDILKIFDLYRITEISTKYINIKSNVDEWKQELKSTIEDRFDQYTKSFTNELDDFTLLSKLNDELMSVYPSIDSDFYNECNSILYQIEQRLIKKNETFISSELNTSSNNNLNYLNEIINSQIYWPPEKKDFIEISHVNFLRKEFYCIINALYPKENIPNVLNCSRSILEERIKRDRSKIKNIFVGFDNKHKLTDNQMVGFSDEMRKGTNYSIRETEKVKEIKVVVESGHLTDAIEQDF